MDVSVSVPVPAAHRHLAAAAAAWASSAHADVDASVRGEHAILSSQGRSEASLRTIWLAAITNEASFVRHKDERARLLQSLFE